MLPCNLKTPMTKMLLKCNVSDEEIQLRGTVTYLRLYSLIREYKEIFWQVEQGQVVEAVEKRGK